MIYMRMNYNDLKKENELIDLYVNGVGTFKIFSGLDPYTNNPNCSYKKDGAIPPGEYWIVDRPKKKYKNQNIDEKNTDKVIENLNKAVTKKNLLDKVIDIKRSLKNDTGNILENSQIEKYIEKYEIINSHIQWFALFSLQTNDDFMIVNGVRRGNFRLHRLGWGIWGNAGFSEGCITFSKKCDFYIVRQALLRTRKEYVKGAKNRLMTYGRVSVLGNADFTKCKVNLSKFDRAKLSLERHPFNPYSFNNDSITNLDK